MKLLAEDRSKIKDVKFNYPWLMNDRAKDSVIEEYYNILQLEDELDKARTYVRQTEKYLKDAKEKFDSKKELFTLEFENKEVEHIDEVKVNISVVNPTDASNRNYTG